MGALTPFMQLHGRANLAPWTVQTRAPEVVRAYRYWSTLHSELVPFFYSLAQEAYANKDTILKPMGSEAAYSLSILLSVSSVFGKTAEFSLSVGVFECAFRDETFMRSL